MVRTFSASIGLALMFFGLFVGQTYAQATSPSLFEPVSGFLFLDLSELNQALEANGFKSLQTPMNFAGSWSLSKLGDWPVGASLMQGGISAGEETRFAQMGIQLISLFAMARFPISEYVVQLQAFVSGGLALGQAQLILTQKSLDENNFGDVLKNPHDTNLSRSFVAALPRLGLELKFGDSVTLRGSVGYLWDFWDSSWTHLAQRIMGPPKNLNGVLIEFTFSYQLPTQSKKE
ncbi:hypothetical protein HYR54_04140 [Candidatus Acetothermia bacterium]|nr:hypothetical protein [Candidatus Acetothermia bacterium]